MSLAPLRPCPGPPGQPRCPHRAVVPSGHCPACSQAYEHHVEHRRGSRIARGYDQQWLNLRAWFIRQPENVLCALCKVEGIVRLTEEIDHIVPFRGRDDPKRLDPENLQGLCRPCHHAKTARRKTAEGL